MRNTELLNFSVLYFIQQTRFSIKIETHFGFFKDKTLSGSWVQSRMPLSEFNSSCPLTVPQWRGGVVRVHGLWAMEGWLGRSSAETGGDGWDCHPKIGIPGPPQVMSSSCSSLPLSVKWGYECTCLTNPLWGLGETMDVKATIIRFSSLAVKPAVVVAVW